MRIDGDTKTGAFLYMRCSGDAQSLGDTWERQTAACARYAQANGYLILKTFKDSGISGTKDLENRPALQDLFAELAADGVKTVLIEKLDRLARDVVIQERLYQEFVNDGVQLISVSEPDLCSDDPSRTLMRQIFGAISAYDRKIIVLKLRGARERKKAKTGKCEGAVGYGGYPAEMETLALIKRYDASGASSKEIAYILTQRGIGTRSGKPWHASSIRKIVARERSASQFPQSSLSSEKVSRT